MQFAYPLILLVEHKLTAVLGNQSKNRHDLVMNNPAKGKNCERDLYTLICTEIYLNK